MVLFETGGVRLQEANLGLAVIAEMQAAIVALRRHVPVVGVISGMVGCFGGMSLAAALCSYLVVTKQGRLGMNGPEVIEQEAGIEELDSSDRRHVWQLIGGEQRAATGFADQPRRGRSGRGARRRARAFTQGVPAAHRTEQVDTYLDRLAQMDPANVTPETMRACFMPALRTAHSQGGRHERHHSHPRRALVPRPRRRARQARARVERRRAARRRNRALHCRRPRSAEPLSARDR